MMKHTETLIKTHYRPIVGLLFAFILVFGINFAIPEANASNPYISNIVFTSDQNDTYLGFHPIKVSFFVNTTFEQTYWQDATGCWSCFGFSPDQVYQANGNHTYYPENPLWNRYILVPVNSDSITTMTCPVGTQTFTAGQTYSFWLSGYYGQFGLESALLYNGLYPASFGVLSNTCNQTAWQDDTEQYPFVEYPTLDITFPFENAEIAEAFNITGSYTLPGASTLDKLMAYFGYGESGETNFYEFYQDVSPPSGDINIRVAGLPAGDYLLGFSFINSSDENDYYMIYEWLDIHILETIPPELPETGEAPPAFFSPIDADQFYLDFSNYDTPTALFINLKSAVQPVFTTIGSNLTFFTSRFDKDMAKETGERTGQAILLIRTYSSNLNTFFNDLPVSEFLLFYLTLLIVVIVFRIIKNLINLIKP